VTAQNIVWVHKQIKINYNYQNKLVDVLIFKENVTNTVDRRSYTNKTKKDVCLLPFDDSRGSIDLIENIKLKLIDPEADFVVSSRWFNKVTCLKL
jgi:hypothetical protein